MTQGKKTAAVTLAATIVTVAATIFLTSLVLSHRDRSLYPSNLYIDGIAAGGQSRSQIEPIIAARLNSGSLKLKLPNHILLSLSMADCGIKVDGKATLNKADKILNQNAGLLGTLKHSVIRGKELNIAPVYQYNYSALYEQLNKLQEKYNRPAINARVLYDKGLLEYIPQQNGYIIDADNTVKRIYTVLQNGSLGPVKAGIIDLFPAVKVEDIKAVKDIIGAYATVNVSAAVTDQIQKLNGTIIMPGQTYVFQPESSPAGMGLALEAVARAGKEAGLDISGLPSGKLVIENRLNKPVLLSITFFNETMQVKILGCQTEPGKEIRLTTEERELKPEVKIQVDESLKPLERVVKQQGKPGTLIRTYRLVTLRGKQVEKTLLTQEVHKGTETIIFEGLQAGIK